jgi:hypothetical protein
LRAQYREDAGEACALSALPTRLVEDILGTEARRR